MQDNATQNRLLFLSFCIEQYKVAKCLSGQEAMRILSRHGVLEYLDESFEVLHTQSAQWILAEIEEYISNHSNNQ